MAVFWADLCLFTKAVARHWRAGVTGGILAVLLLLASVYHPLSKYVIGAALVGYLIVAAFYAWREEHKKAQERETARHKAVTECFERCVQIMENGPRMPFNALVQANGHQLETADEVLSVCIQMEAYGRGDPFTEIDKIVPDDKRLAFLKFFRFSEYDKNDEIAYLDAAQDWATRFGVSVPSETKLKLLMRKILPWS